MNMVNGTLIGYVFCPRMFISYDDVVLTFCERVHCFPADFFFVSGSASRELLREPTGVVCFDGRLFVADSRNHRVQVCVCL